MLKPLEQFICDKCKGVINSPENGYVEFLNFTDNSDEFAKIRGGFRIVHHNGHNNCYCYERSVNQQTIPLTEFLGENKFNLIFSFLDEGAHFSPDRPNDKVHDLREFVDFCRRLTIPYYEEARLYFEMAKSDGFFDGENEVSLYSPIKMKEIVEAFSSYEK